MSKVDQTQQFDIISSSCQSMTSTTPCATSSPTNNEDGNEKTSRRRNPQSTTLYSFERDPKLRTRIGLYSNTLDKLASSIDSVMSHNDEEVKGRKKSLSNNIVKLMDELDKLISSSTFL